MTTQNLYHHRICPCSPTCPVFFSSAEDLCQLFLCLLADSINGVIRASSERKREARLILFLFFYCQVLFQSWLCLSHSSRSFPTSLPSTVPTHKELALRALASVSSLGSPSLCNFSLGIVFVLSGPWLTLPHSRYACNLTAPLENPGVCFCFHDVGW